MAGAAAPRENGLDIVLGASKGPCPGEKEFEQLTRVPLSPLVLVEWRVHPCLYCFVAGFPTRTAIGYRDSRRTSYLRF